MLTYMCDRCGEKIPYNTKTKEFGGVVNGEIKPYTSMNKFMARVSVLSNANVSVDLCTNCVVSVIRGNEYVDEPAECK